MRTALALDDGDQRHGTYNGYNNLGCRCGACRAAFTAETRRKGWASYKRIECPRCGGAMAAYSDLCRHCFHVSVEAPHGTASRYKRCKCDECRAAAAKDRRERRHKNIEATRAYDREYRRRKRAAA